MVRDAILRRGFTVQDADRWCSQTPCGQEFWQILCQWVWNLRLRLGHALHPTAMRMTEFAPAAVSAEPASVVPSTRKNDARNGMEPCVWCMRLALVIVVPVPYASAVSGTGPRPRKHGAKVAVLHPQRSAPTPPLNEPAPTRLAAYPILWGDWQRRSPRREFMKLLRHQRVDVRMAATSPPAQPPPARPLSRAQRAHSRLSWAELLARNALPSASPSVSITLFGIPDAFAQSIGLQTL